MNTESALPGVKAGYRIQRGGNARAKGLRSEGNGELDGLNQASVRGTGVRVVR